MSTPDLNDTEQAALDQLKDYLDDPPPPQALGFLELRKPEYTSKILKEGLIHVLENIFKHGSESQKLAELATKQYPTKIDLYEWSRRLEENLDYLESIYAFNDLDVENYASSIRSTHYEDGNMFRRSIMVAARIAKNVKGGYAKLATKIAVEQGDIEDPDKTPTP
jgi:hypothetical protein